MHLNDDRTRRTLKFSILDGAFASAMTGLTQDYFAPFLLLLGATSKHIGMLTALPNLFASILQANSADFAQKLQSRRKVVNLFVLLHAFMLLPMVLIALMTKSSPYIFIAIVTAFTSLVAIANPAWASVMSDLVPQQKRGSYFGWRNKMLGFVTVIFAFIAGLILNVTKGVNVFYGFAVIFSAAFIFRMISWYFLTKMHEPHLEYKKEYYFNLFDFISRMHESNFARFVIFVSLMNFSVNFGSPFITVLMLRDLHFSYMLYTTITIASTFTIFLMMARWGNIADRVGNLKIIKFTSVFIAIIPLLWIVNRHPAYLIFIQIFAGFMWAGFNLCTTNFIYDAVTPEKRTRCISYFNMFNGMAICAGALAGGFMVSRLPPLFGYKILTLLLISFFLRITIGLFVPFKLKEVRPVKAIKNNDLFFSVIGIKPIIQDYE